MDIDETADINSILVYLYLEGIEIEVQSLDIGINTVVFLGLLSNNDYEIVVTVDYDLGDNSSGASMQYDQVLTVSTIKTLEKAIPEISETAFTNPVLDTGPGGLAYNRVKNYYKDFSPIHNITNTIPPAIILLGDKDHIVPFSTAEKFKKLMEEQGVQSELSIYEGQGHGFFNVGKGGKKVFLQTLEDMDGFLQKFGFLDGELTAKGWFKEIE